MKPPVHTMNRNALQEELREGGHNPGIGLTVETLRRRLGALRRELGEASSQSIAGAMLLQIRDSTGNDATVHTIDGYDPPNEFCVHPSSDPNLEFRAPTLEQACREALEWARANPKREETPR